MLTTTSPVVLACAEIADEELVALLEARKAARLAYGEISVMADVLRHWSDDDRRIIEFRGFIGGVWREEGLTNAIGPAFDGVVGAFIASLDAIRNKLDEEISMLGGNA